MKRREFLARSGALVVSFALPRATAQEGGGAGSSNLPGSLAKAPALDAWIRVGANGSITVFTGKAELGQGIKTALLQIAAEELDVAFAALTIVTADTARTANEGYTAGSNSLKDSGVAIRNAAAQVRALLVAQAAKRLGAGADSLHTADGAVVSGDGKRIPYAELVDGLDLHVEAAPMSTFKDPKQYRVVSRPVARVDIPAKVSGGAAYVQDLRLPGMVHARVVRPPSYGATLAAVDEAGAAPFGAKVVRDGSFLAVVAPREWSAIKAMRALERSARWDERARLPDIAHLADAVLGLPAEDMVVEDHHAAAPGSARTLEATFTRHYQVHGSIGPSCAVAWMKDDGLTIWSHTQGVYPDRQAIAEMLGLPPARIRMIHAEGSGCYGHNGADDAAADAALIATRLPGTPVRVQWMREQEHAWEPFGPAMVTKVRAALDGSGRIVDWDYGVWSNSHSTRPGPAGSLLAAQHGAKAFAPPRQKVSKSADGLGDRNSVPLYSIPNLHVVHHFLPDMPVRVSALRSLGAYMNVFSIESFMDELAAAAGADPVEFRLSHLEDARGRDVVQAAARRFGWPRGGSAPAGHGYGFAFARYKNHAAYCAVAVEVAWDAERSRARVLRAAAAVDSGQVVNPDGLRNQLEGAILQSASWTLFEKVSFDRQRIRSTDWSTYPILRFDGVPEKVEIEILDRPGAPYLGSGECGQGPAAAAIANAVARASGKRLRDIPFRG
ncbi:MAG TPA: molybdopterin cofactor-binding domain-containing protein [Usitatibacter sp.]|jgi:CO/xanthine dehydrogenase Mo-binding subunit|nr:molybdopterin cofactor-binding domain-containing protein [Usitatibacter sp.]